MIAANVPLALAVKFLPLACIGWVFFCLTLSTAVHQNNEYSESIIVSTSPQSAFYEKREKSDPQTPVVDKYLRWNQDMAPKVDNTVKSIQGKPRKVVLAGIVRDTSEIYPSVWATLSDLSCQYETSIHIIAGHDGSDAVFNRSSDFCAPFQLELEDSLVVQDRRPKNRVQRLGQLRDVQRGRVQELFFSDDESKTIKDYYSESVIMLADLDLMDLPTAKDIAERINLIADPDQPQETASATSRNHDSEFQIDGICAYGKIVKVTKSEPDTYCMSTSFAWNEALKKRVFTKKRKPCIGERRKTTDIYYDTFATIFWPNTFAHPVGSRLHPEEIVGEDISFLKDAKYAFSPNVQSIADSSVYGIHPKRSPHALASVRSCFSGLALYRASTYLTPQCQYSLKLEGGDDESISESSRLFMQNQPRLSSGELEVLRYASLEEGLPCEHVTFHECLHRTVFSKQQRLVMDPKLITYWRQVEQPH